MTKDPLQKKAAWIFLADLPKQKASPITEYVIGGSETILLQLRKNYFHLLVPLIGGIDMQKGADEKIFLVAGQALIVCSSEEDLIFMKNPFQHSSILFLHIELKNEKDQSYRIYEQCCFDLTGKGASTTEMVRIFEAVDGLPFLFSVLQLKGREEITYCSPGQFNQSIIHVAQGAFECEGMLLHAGDSLLLSHYKTIDTEALSEGAILFLLEW